MQNLIDWILWLPKYIFLRHYVVYVHTSTRRDEVFTKGAEKIRAMKKRLFGKDKKP